MKNGNGRVDLLLLLHGGVACVYATVNVLIISTKTRGLFSSTLIAAIILVLGGGDRPEKRTNTWKRTNIGCVNVFLLDLLAKWPKENALQNWNKI